MHKLLFYNKQWSLCPLCNTFVGQNTHFCHPGVILFGFDESRLDFLSKEKTCLEGIPWSRVLRKMEFTPQNNCDVQKKINVIVMSHVIVGKKLCAVSYEIFISIVH